MNGAATGREARRLMARILAVDDSRAAIAWVRAVLEPAGHTVDTLSSFVTLYPYLRDTPPDLILLDVEMPAMSGPDFANFVKRYQKTPIPVLLHSSASPAVVRQAAKDCGASGTVPKNAGADALKRAVEAVLHPQEQGHQPTTAPV